MKQQIYTFQLAPDWELINIISRIDRFGGSWETIEKREGQSLKELKSIATVRSVGASTRIEGSKLTDDEVTILIKNLDISKLQERDQQEVVGYFETLDIIAESYRDIDITENNLQHLHHILMRYSEKDTWHKGKYKQHSNVVEATMPDGSKYTVFQTTEPGFATEDAMRKLVEWYNSEKETHPIVRSALFVYEFLSIHPFQDGNGRLSRLLATLLLLRHGYSWIQYVSFEHEIENRKGEYYKVLMQCQQQRPGEDVYPWTTFFMNCLSKIQEQLMRKLENKISSGIQLSPRNKKIYSFVESHPGSRSGEIAERLNIPLPTVKRILSDMVANKALVKHGIGAGTNYTVGNFSDFKKDFIMRLSNEQRSKEILLMKPEAFIKIKKIILSPLFEWVKPDEWSSRLINQGLGLSVVTENSKGRVITSEYSISSYNSPDYFQPVFNLANPIMIPLTFEGETPFKNEFPIKVKIEIKSVTENFDFEVMLVYDGMTE